MAGHRVLLVDDDPIIRSAIRSYLQTEGFTVAEAGSCLEAQQEFSSCTPDAALLDFSLPDGDGLDLLRLIRDYDSEIPIIVLTGQGSIELAVRAMSEGARNFLTKPVQLAAVTATLRREIENRHLRQQSIIMRSRNSSGELYPFVGQSAVIRRLHELATRVLDHESPVLITGETGSGKGVLAHWLHAQSPRSAEPFLDLNCAGLSKEFLDTELFGHERGAFTGAIQAKAGLLEVADRGTVFLDEIGDMDLAVQAKLLKVLEARRFRRLGAVRDRAVDIRLVAATHRDLREMIAKSQFREDLYYRISIIPLQVPPLRKRLEDLPELAYCILNRIGRRRGRGEMSLDLSAVQALQRYSWPGNLRELHNVLERAVLIADHDQLSMRDLQFQTLGSEARQLVAEPSSNSTLEEMERYQIELALHEEGGSMERTAQRLGIARSSLYNKVKRLGLRRTRCTASSQK